VLDSVLRGFQVFSMSVSAVAGGCVQANQIHPIPTTGLRSSGSIQIERIEGEQRLLTLEFEQLAAPETLDPNLHVFTVWLADSRGRTVKAGQLRYDPARRSANLATTTELSAFTVQVTGERDTDASAPSGFVLAQRKVTD
jgi:hypothetical protein